MNAFKVEICIFCTSLANTLLIIISRFSQSICIVYPLTQSSGHNMLIPEVIWSTESAIFISGHIKNRFNTTKNFHRSCNFISLTNYWICGYVLTCNAHCFVQVSSDLLFSVTCRNQPHTLWCTSHWTLDAEQQQIRTHNNFVVASSRRRHFLVARRFRDERIKQHGQWKYLKYSISVISVSAKFN